MTRDEARLVGQTRYVTTAPCRNGHLAGRFTRSNKCCECQRINQGIQRKREGITGRREEKREAEAMKARPIRLPIAPPGFLKPLTRERLMAGRA